MESLKPFKSILEEDPRFVSMMTFGRDDDEAQIYTFEHHYQRYSLLEPPSAASEEIINGLITAQHLAIYSWFVFPFISSAEFQALSTLEHAIRRTMFNKPARGLKMRLKEAVNKGLLTGAKLKLLDPFIFPDSSKFLNRPFDVNGEQALKDFINSLPEERNWLAHGNWVGGGDAFLTLDIVFQLVTQLYSRDH
jgi:hypothetical protein